MKGTLLVLLLCPVVSAGEFVNLTFDDPDLSNVELLQLPDSQMWLRYAPVEEALRGWTVSEPMLGLVKYTIDGGICIENSVSPFSLMPLNIGVSTPPYVIAVSTSLLPGGPFIERLSFDLTQSGRVPESAARLRFFNSPGGSLEPVFAFINGQPVDARRFDQDISLFEIDVLPFAGQEVELSFQFPAGQSHRFDIIGFLPIPEPSPAALLVVGGGLLLAGRRRRKQITGRRTGRTSSCVPAW